MVLAQAACGIAWESADAIVLVIQIDEELHCRSVPNCRDCYNDGRKEIGEASANAFRDDNRVGEMMTQVEKVVSKQVPVRAS